MNPALRSWAAAFCITALAACSSPSSGTAFKAPAGWRSSPGVMGRFQMWMNGTNAADRQIVILVRGDQHMNVIQTSSWGGTQDVRDLKHQTITLCGSQHADYFTGTAESQSGSTSRRRTLEGVMTSIGDSKYAALYVRPAGSAADPQAETALHSLCPSP